MSDRLLESELQALLLVNGEELPGYGIDGDRGGETNAAIASYLENHPMEGLSADSPTSEIIAHIQATMQATWEPEDFSAIAELQQNGRGTPTEDAFMIQATVRAMGGDIAFDGHAWDGTRTGIAAVEENLATRSEPAAVAAVDTVEPEPVLETAMAEATTPEPEIQPTRNPHPDASLKASDSVSEHFNAAMSGTIVFPMPTTVETSVSSVRDVPPIPMASPIDLTDILNASAQPQQDYIFTITANNLDFMLAGGDRLPPYIVNHINGDISDASFDQAYAAFMDVVRNDPETAATLITDAMKAQLTMNGEEWAEYRDSVGAYFQNTGAVMLGVNSIVIGQKVDEALETFLNAPVPENTPGITPVPMS